MSDPLRATGANLAKSGKIFLMNGNLSKENVFEIFLPVSTDDGAFGKMAHMLLDDTSLKGRLNMVGTTLTTGQERQDAEL